MRAYSSLLIVARRQIMLAAQISIAAAIGNAQTFEFGPMLPPDHAMIGHTINQQGHVAGTDTGGITAALWTPQTGVISLGILNGQRSVAYGMNDNGQVVGASHYLDQVGGPYHAFVWRNGVMTEIDPFLIRESYASAINQSGLIVGAAVLPGDQGNNFHAFAAIDNNANGSYGTNEWMYLPSLSANPNSRFDLPNAVNNAGLVVGQSQGRAALWYMDGFPFSWQVADLSFAPGFAWPLVEATAINDVGQIVGYTLDAVNGGRIGFVFHDLNGNRHIDVGEVDLLPAIPFHDMLPLNINNRGDIVGLATNRSNNVSRPFLIRDGHALDLACLIDLPDCGDYFRDEASAINDAGQILLQQGNLSLRLDPLPNATYQYPDADADFVCDCRDNCPNFYNPLQEDSDFDGVGDPCDSEFCPGDLLHDRVIDLQDLAIQLASFGRSRTFGNNFRFGDIDGDGDIDLQDLSFMLARFGNQCP